MAYVGTPSERQAAVTQALNALDLTPESLMKIARKIANDYKRANSIRLGDKDEDFVSYLTETGLRAALRYDPRRARGDQGISFVWKIMERRCDDFYRRKSEGFGDRRYGNDGRVVLTSFADTEPKGSDFLTLLDAELVERCEDIARQTGTDTTTWIFSQLGKAARAQLGPDDYREARLNGTAELSPDYDIKTIARPDLVSTWIQAAAHQDIPLDEWMHDAITAATLAAEKQAA